METRTIAIKVLRFFALQKCICNTCAGYVRFFNICPIFQISNFNLNIPGSPASFNVFIRKHQKILVLLLENYSSSQLIYRDHFTFLKILCG